MSRKVVALSFIIFIVFAFRKAEDFIPKHWPEPNYNFTSNPLSKEKMELGRALFYDPMLSGNLKVSCADCHNPYNAFAHTDHKLSHGINDSIGTRNAPPLFNLAWQKHFMWDGSVNHLDMQSLRPIHSPTEMGSSIQEVIEKLNQSNKYRIAFKKAWGSKGISSERTLKSLSQFLLSLNSHQSKYDSVKLGHASFTAQEQNGYHIFQKHCNTCHCEPLFTNTHFESNGLAIDTLLKDWGRMTVTQDANDSLKFKVPSLRNLSYTFPYMHDGRFQNLRAVVNHYTKPLQGRKTEKLTKAISLNSNDQVDLMVFLLCLNDPNFIRKKEFQYPRTFLLEE